MIASGLNGAHGIVVVLRAKEELARKEERSKRLIFMVERLASPKRAQLMVETLKTAIRTLNLAMTMSIALVKIIIFRIHFI